MKALRILLGLFVILVLGLLGFAAFAWRSAIDPISPQQAANVDPALVARGAQLAAIGNCNVCHTAPGGAVLAGGLALPTPFGTIYSTNITPEPDTGIGRWSEAAFQRAMRSGVRRDGAHLYPAFPYDHFTLVSDEDNRALYAFLMSRAPVRNEARANDLRFPFNIRLLLAGWKLLFFREGPYQATAGQSQETSRGAYLVEGLGHCGACHTPRNGLGAEKKDARFGGGEAEGWTAYALNSASPAPVPWDAESLYGYLRRGWHEAHGVARGPMAPVVENLGSVSDADVRAIAAYVATIAGEPSPERKQRGEAVLAAARKLGQSAGTAANDSQGNSGAPGNAGAASGAVIYAGACANCHESGRALPFGGLPLILSSAMNGPNPHNLVNVTLAGLPPAEGEASPIMPGFSGVLSDQQLAALVGYLRSRFSDKPAWDNVEKDIRDARTGERAVSVRPAPGTQSAPADASQREKKW